MSRRRARGPASARRVGSFIIAGALVALAGCAAGPMPPGRSDGAIDGSTMDAASVEVDSGPITTPDAGPPDSGPPDGGPVIVRQTCEACEDHDDCAPGSYCANLVDGRACLPGCNPDIPACPRSFNCIVDITLGVDTPVCAPVGGACCVDEDADEYGQGIGCMGTDCDDAEATVNPGAPETCNGVDDDCDEMADDPPTDCLSGRCTMLTDGTYEAVEGADCMDAMCAEGTTTPCGLFTCEDGGEAGNRCAMTCAPDGTDDDTLCIAGAHCDAGACVMDEPDGGMCDEDSDCTAAHCDNGFCCTGTLACCSTTTDCPGGGAVTQVCTDPETCQGTRAETTCVAYQCQPMDGIPDDTACDTSTRSRDCGLYDPIYCAGGSDQTAPDCPTTCGADADCVESAHCDFGACIPDRPQAGSCTRTQDCQDGLFCVDGVCCDSACTGTCEACNVAPMPGTCLPVPLMQDPAGECPGYSCAGYFTGFGAGEDACYQYQDVSAAAATCSGARSCIDPATMCALQPRGPEQINCDNTCQAPISGTCTGTTPGACRDLDSPSDMVSCGTGECRRTVQRCTGGLPTTCSPGTPVVETCNGLDDDCNGTPDNGSGAALCPAAANAETYTCASGTCSFTCLSGRVDLNGTYGDGCECVNPPHSTTCAAATALPNVGPSQTLIGLIAPGEEDWFSVGFPDSGRGSTANGSPQIRLTGGNAGNFELDFYRTCSAAQSCGTGTASGVGSFSFVDNQSTSGTNQWSTHDVDWPATVIFRVRRVAPATTCGAATYTIAISR